MANTRVEPDDMQSQQDRKGGGVGRAMSWCAYQAKRPFRRVEIETPNGKFSKTWHPTKKWWIALITALGTFATNWIQAGEFNTEIQIALVGLMTAALTSYVARNDPTPGGYQGSMVEDSGGTT